MIGKPKQLSSFFICKFSINNKDHVSKVLSNGFTIIYPRADPGQLDNGMYKMFLDKENDHSVIVKIPYLSYGMQHSIQSCSACCKVLSRKQKLLHRKLHEDCINAAIQDVLESANLSVESRGFRLVNYRITFSGFTLSDRFYGDKGRLNLQAVASVLQETVFDAQARSNS